MICIFVCEHNPEGDRYRHGVAPKPLWTLKVMCIFVYEHNSGDRDGYEVDLPITTTAKGDAYITWLFCIW